MCAWQFFSQKYIFWGEKHVIFFKRNGILKKGKCLFEKKHVCVDQCWLYWSLAMTFSVWTRQLLDSWWPRRWPRADPAILICRTWDPALLVGFIIIFPCRIAIGIIGTSAIWDNSKWHWHSYSQVQAQVPLRGSHSWQGPAWIMEAGQFLAHHVPPLELEFRSGNRPFLTECFQRIGLLSPLS